MALIRKMTEKLHDGFSLIELMVALGISTTILTLAFLTYGKIYTDSAKLEKYLKDEIIFHDEFARIYRDFQNTTPTPIVVPSSYSLIQNSPIPNCATPPAAYNPDHDYSSDCLANIITKSEVGQEPRIAYIYSQLRP